MSYGTLKVDQITFTSNSVDTTVNISGLIRNPVFSGNVTVTGTVSGSLVKGTTVSGTTITGDTGTFTTLTAISGTFSSVTGSAAGFTTITGITVTGENANFISGSFSNRISGATIVGVTGVFTTLSGSTVTGGVVNAVSGIFSNTLSGTFITGNGGSFTSLTGVTITGSTGQFSNLTGISGVFTSQISGALYKAANDVTVISGSGDVRPYGLYSFPATTSISGYQLITNADGSTSWASKNRSVSAAAVSGTLTPNINTTDLFVASGLTGAITFGIPTGTPEDGQKLLIRVKDNGTARAITWTQTTSGYRAIGVTLPATTTASKITYVGCIYNSVDIFWDVIGVKTQF